MKKFLIIFGLSSAFFSGCGTPIYVARDYDPAGNFAALKTYAWDAAAPQRTGDPRVDNSIVESRIHRATDKILSEHGYTRLTNGAAPDFLVGYHASIRPRTDVTRVSTPVSGFHHYNYYDDWYGTGWYDGLWRDKTFVSTYEEGRLIIDLIDAKTKRLIWQGMARAAIDENASPEERDKKVQNAVRKMFKNFPPKIQKTAAIASAPPASNLGA